MCEKTLAKQAQRKRNDLTTSHRELQALVQPVQAHGRERE